MENRMSKKDLIIGGCSGYDWSQLQYWVNSIRRSGFDGDVALVATNITKETIDKLTSQGIILELYGNQDKHGGFTANGGEAHTPHVARFFYIWNFLNHNQDKYRYVITTDVKDVIFQRNPSLWLNNYSIGLNGSELVCSSEGMKYKSEPWGAKNFYDTFGPFFFEKYKDNLIYNVGVIAGTETYVRDLLLMIFQMSINRPIPVVDQAVYNFLISQSMFDDVAYKVRNNNLWAIQLGTTIHAIDSGSGDIGLEVQNDQSKRIIYQTNYIDKQPKILDDGMVVDAPFNEAFTIVHQYDRVHGLKEKLEGRYGD